MKKFSLPTVLASVAATAVISLGGALPAHAANADPSPFTPVGTSWVTVPTADRIYLQPGAADAFDDEAFGEIPAGVTCDSGAIDGPALVLLDSDLTCEDGGAPFDPAKVDFGFTINFYGQDVTGGWPNSDASFTFDEPVANYDDSLAFITADEATSGLYLGAMDLDFTTGESNLWIARTTVDGHPAFVVSWEKFNSHESVRGRHGYQTNQAVIMDLGNGDFNMYLNTDEFSVNDQGNDQFDYAADLNASDGTNVVTVHTINGFPETACQELVSNAYSFSGTADLSDLADEATVYGQLVSAADQTIALFSDDTCTTPLNISQKEVGDYAILHFVPDPSVVSAPFGWGSYNTTTGVINVFELFPNLSLRPLLTGGANQMISYSLNTDVPGRILIGMRDGGVASTDELAASIAPALANTGVDAASLLSGGVLLALAGITAIMVIRRRKSA